MKSLSRRWKRDEEKAAKQMLLGKTANERIAGLSRSKRNEAKMILLAILPLLVVGIFSAKWSVASDIQKILIVFALIWAAGVMAIGLYTMVRSTVRAMKDRNR